MQEVIKFTSDKDIKAFRNDIQDRLQNYSACYVTSVLNKLSGIVAPCQITILWNEEQDNFTIV